jgi:hypothetical protein
MIIRYVSLNITEKIIIIRKPNIFTETQTQESFRFVTVIPAISSPKQTILFFAPFYPA